MTITGVPRKFGLAPDDPDRAWVLARMADLTGARRGWVNIQPALHEDDTVEAPPRPPGWLASRAPAVPLATWTAPSANRKGPVPAQVGIQHGAGMRALPWLREQGVPRPEGWRTVSDSPMRGVVLELPDGVAPVEILDWIVGAASRLCPAEPAGRWQATVFDPEG